MFSMTELFECNDYVFAFFQTENGPPNTSVTLYDLHNHNEYIVMLRARTKTGFGKVTQEIINLGN